MRLPTRIRAWRRYFEYGQESHREGCIEENGRCGGSGGVVEQEAFGACH
ncbi:hypothetical protein [Neisseria sp. LACPHL-SPEC-2024-00856]